MINNSGSFITLKRPLSDSAEITSSQKVAVRETEKTGKEVSSSSMVSVLLGQGKLAEVQKSIAPDITAPAVAPDSSLLRQQFQEFGGRLQTIQVKQERAGEVTSKSENHASSPGNIDFSASNVQRQDSSAASGEQGAGQEQQSSSKERRSQAGSGLLDGAMSAKSQLMVDLMHSQFKMRDADRTSAVESGKLSFKSTQLAADKEIASGRARRNELITGAATSFGMTAVGTAQSHRGISTQKSALNNHKAPSMTAQNRSATLNHTGQVKTGSQLPGAAAVNGNAGKLAADTPDRIQRDHAALSRPAQNHQQRQTEHEFEFGHMQLDGQRRQQQGQAISMSASSAGGLAGSQFGMDASQAQSERMIADGNTRMHEGTASQKEKQAEADAAVIAALMAAMQQAATSNADAGSTVANNMSR